MSARPPWPIVAECHTRAPSLVAQGHRCPQCDGSMIWGDDEKPWQWLLTDTIGFGDHTETRWLTKCARNGHAPCAHCGQPLPRTNDGCPRAHNWRSCPAKTEAHRMQPQHAAPGHQDRRAP